MVVLPNQVHELRKLALSEDQHTEWKKSWRDEYLKWICGFAAGGVLVIGRDDDGKIIGIDNAEKLLVDLPNKVRDILGIIVDVDLSKSTLSRFREQALSAKRLTRREVIESDSGRNY